MKFVDHSETNHVRMYQFGNDPKWLALSPEARCVYALLRMHVCEDGSIPIGFGSPEVALSRLLRLDVEFVARALEELLDPEERYLLWNQALGELMDPAHVEGENASWSPSFRKKRFRDRSLALDSRKRRLKHANVAAFPSEAERRVPKTSALSKNDPPLLARIAPPRRTAGAPRI